MPRAPTLLLGAAGVLLTAGMTAFVALGGSVGAWVAVGGGAIVAAAGFGLGTRWAREHVPGLRTFAMELAAQRDACLALRVQLKRQRTAQLALDRRRRKSTAGAVELDPLEPWTPGGRGLTSGMPGFGLSSKGCCRTSGGSIVARMP